jgi:sialate O-acetylesterase
MKSASLLTQTAITGIAALSLCIVVAPAQADVTLSPLIGDNMVFQREAALRVWGKANPGEKVTVTFPAAKAEATTKPDGTWEVSLPPQKAGGPYTLTITGKNTLSLKNILIGDVWLCGGQSNMQLSLQRASTGPQAIAASTDSNLRLFKVSLAQPESPVDTVKGSWQESSPTSTPAFSAVGYFFGRALRTAEKVPIGLIASSWGGTPAQAWTREAVLTANPFLKGRFVDPYPANKATHDKLMADYRVALEKAKAEGKKEPKKPNSFWRYSSLYNGMIAPLTTLPIRGVIWYQGETNSGDPTGYATLLPAMIQDWRAQWNAPQMPFLIVQLPPFGTQAGNGLGWAQMRENQEHIAQTLPNVGLVVTTDVGTQHDIHPTNKEPVGERLALQARSISYGEKGLVASGPTYKSLKIDGAKTIVTFENVGEGLAIHGGQSSDNPVPADSLVGFTIAGDDGKFVPAQAKIIGKNTVEVSASEVSSPKAVRYGYVNFPIVNLWNKNGLPAHPFRTDQKK